MCISDWRSDVCASYLLDFAEQQATKESFPSDEIRIKSEQGSWTAAKENASSYGIPGALSDQAPPPAVPGSQPANAAPGAAQTAEAAGKTAENYVREDRKSVV